MRRAARLLVPGCGFLGCALWLGLAGAALAQTTPDQPAAPGQPAALAEQRAGDERAGDERAARVELVMLEEMGCPWCRRWDAEIGPIYPKTAEGRRAPLRRIDLHATTPPDLSFKTPARFSPTFILVADGAEVGRIEGYPGEDFFWGLLGRLIEKLDDRDAATAAPSL